MECSKQEHENEQEGDGHNNQQAITATFQVFPQTAPLQDVARWQLHIARDGGLRLHNKASNVAASYVDLH